MMAGGEVTTGGEDAMQTRLALSWIGTTGAGPAWMYDALVDGQSDHGADQQIVHELPRCALEVFAGTRRHARGQPHKRHPGDRPARCSGHPDLADGRHTYRLRPTGRRAAGGHRGPCRDQLVCRHCDFRCGVVGQTMTAQYGWWRVRYPVRPDRSTT